MEDLPSLPDIPLDSGDVSEAAQRAAYGRCVEDVPEDLEPLAWQPFDGEVAAERRTCIA